ncbi:hypothetical protein AXG93_1054s1040 [Marchantia polymorpha subsp. ruderalis]|uniref:DAGKc domain-containing protein n=1 Tax=Marchantia polymorpha subsp. ruderalis TaxID=1480154 RepID=A0A176WMD7_MARPO|nr:hypothetical protein AXG93_1054s1040 [Marchantia polymorpha subsp. ruderalis]
MQKDEGVTEQVLRLGKVFIRAGCVQGQRRAREAVSDLDVVLVVDQRIRSPSGTLGSANAGRGHWPVPFLAVNCARNHVRVDRRRRALVLQALDVVFDGPGCPIDREELRYGNLWLRFWMMISWDELYLLLQVCVVQLSHRKGGVARHLKLNYCWKNKSRSAVTYLAGRKLKRFALEVVNMGETFERIPLEAEGENYGEDPSSPGKLRKVIPLQNFLKNSEGSGNLEVVMEQELYLEKFGYVNVVLVRDCLSWQLVDSDDLIGTSCWGGRKDLEKSRDQVLVSEIFAVEYSGLSNPASIGMCGPFTNPLPQVLINPYGGKKAGVRQWETVAPLFHKAGVKTKVLLTERAQHAYDLMAQSTEEELKNLDGVIVVGGDGLFNEVLNGLVMHRHKGHPAPNPERVLDLMAKRWKTKKRNNSSSHLPSEEGLRALSNMERKNDQSSGPSFDVHSPLLTDSPLESRAVSYYSAPSSSSSSPDSSINKSLKSRMDQQAVVYAMPSKEIELTTRDSFDSSIAITSEAEPLRVGADSTFLPAASKDVVGSASTRDPGKLQYSGSNRHKTNAPLRIGIIPAGSTDTVAISLVPGPSFKGPKAIFRRTAWGRPAEIGPLRAFSDEERKVRAW